MPLTAVGKLFKPELVCREIHQVIALALESIFEATELVINVQPDKKHGILANLSVSGKKDLVETEQTIKERLASYSFNYEIESATH